MRWEDKYDLEYVIFNPLGNDKDFLRFDTKPEEIKSFIKSLLKEQRESIFKFIEEQLDICPEDEAIKKNCGRCKDYYKFKRELSEPEGK